MLSIGIKQELQIITPYLSLMPALSGRGQLRECPSAYPYLKRTRAPHHLVYSPPRDGHGANPGKARIQATGTAPARTPVTAAVVYFQGVPRAWISDDRYFDGAL